MLKNALAVALLSVGLGLAGHAPVDAAPLPSGVAASSARVADDTLVKVGCLDEVPVVSGLVALYDILSDDEYECHRRFHGDDRDWRTYDEPKHPNYKDGGYAEPKDQKKLR